MQIVAISDTHGQHHNLPTLPKGDLLLHSGDFSSRGRLKEFQEFAEWFGSQPHEHKIACPGNHDFICEREPDLCREIAKENNFFLGIDEAFFIDGIQIFCSPWTNYFHGWAFNAYEIELVSKFSRIPVDIDILVTHGPPKTNTFIDRNEEGEHCGSQALLALLPKLTRLKYCVFGHTHEGYGVLEGLKRNPWDVHHEGTFINASLVGGKDCGWSRLDPRREPFVFNVPSWKDKRLS